MFNVAGEGQRCSAIGSAPTAVEGEFVLRTRQDWPPEGCTNAMLPRTSPLVYNLESDVSRTDQDPQMVHANDNPRVTIEEVTDPREIARHRVQDERHARNLKWLESHWPDLPNAPGRYVAVANEQAFVTETAAAAWDWARSEHPHDDGAVVMLVPAEKGWRIYANFR
jgi:hypothetical protein